VVHQLRFEHDISTIHLYSVATIPAYSASTMFLKCAGFCFVFWNYVAVSVSPKSIGV